MESNNRMNCEALKEITLTIKELDKRISSIEADRELQNFKYEQIINTLSEIKGDLKELKEKPAKHWDLIITTVITGVVAFVIGKIF